MNMGVPRWTQVIIGLIVAFIILIIVVIVYFMFTVEVSGQIYIHYRASPPGINCESFIEAETLERVKVLASIEYAYLDSKELTYEDMNNKISQTGALPCFCQYEAAQGAAADAQYLFNWNKKEDGEDVTLYEPICKK